MLDLIKKKPKIILTAIAGSGKSILMKYLFLSMAKKRFGRVPLFLELRNLNDISTPDIFTYMYAQINVLNAEFSTDDFEFALKSGMFCFLFDGFDEVKTDLQALITKQIHELCYRFPDVPMLVSSRPDDMFIAWKEFDEYRVLPYEKEQVIELLNKIDFDQKTRSLLISRIKDGLFDSHREFLSNPLLASMMLLTFSTSYDIPAKRHIFYQRTFAALAEKHDASKGYKRKLKTALDEDDFERLFAAFCIGSYLKDKITFTPEEAKEYAETAYKMTSLGGQGADLFEDLVKNLCVLIKDGETFRFLHRSFQEYFAALYIVRSPPKKAKVIIEKLLAEKTFPRNALTLAHNINPELIEREIVIPMLISTLAELGRLKAIHGPEAFGRLCSLCVERHEMPKENKSDIHVAFVIGEKGQHLQRGSEVLFLLRVLNLRNPASRSRADKYTFMRKTTSAWARESSDIDGIEPPVEFIPKEIYAHYLAVANHLEHRLKDSLSGLQKKYADADDAMDVLLQ